MPIGGVIIAGVGMARHGEGGRRHVSMEKHGASEIGGAARRRRHLAPCLPIDAEVTKMCVNLATSVDAAFVAREIDVERNIGLMRLQPSVAAAAHADASMK